MFELEKKRLFPSRVDGVIDAARYSANGRIHWVRAYERRGPTWSDHVLLDRETLIERLRAGKRFYGGKRIIYHGSEFELGKAIGLRQTKKGEAIVTEGTDSDRDQLNDVPAI